MLLPCLIFLLDAFLIGLLFGSLLNVCIVRLPRGESIVTPRSHCMACGHLVRWYDNLPVLSWLVLRARCRDCGAKIPWRYPLVELAVGLWFGNTWLQTWVRAGNEHNGQVGPWMTQRITDQYFAEASIAILGFLLIGLMVMDWQTHRLPDAFTLTGTAIGLFLVCVQAIFLAPGEGAVVLADQHIRLRSPGAGAYEGNVFLTGPEALIFGRVAAVAGAALILLVVRWAYKAVRKRDGMGLGDVKMLAMIAAFLGFGESLVALFAGAIAASVFAMILLARGKAGATTRLPFGSFLAVGGLVAALFGEGIVGWYMGLLH